MTGKTVYLHVGPEKTGTTSLQNALFNSREELLRHGIRYWSISANHSWPLVLLLHSNTTNHPGFRESLFEQETVRYGSVETIRKQLTDELKASERFVISGEIASHLPEADLLKLHELLRISGAITKIVYYVREPRGWLNSVVLQRLKAGVPIDDAIAVNRRLPYRKTIEQLDRLFGKDNVRLRLYTQNNDPSQNLMADFLDAIGLPKELSAQFPLTWENAAMSETIAQILDSICRLAQAEGSNRSTDGSSASFLNRSSKDRPIASTRPY